MGAGAEPSRLGRVRALVDRVLRVGGVPGETPDDRLRRQFLVGTTIAVLPAGIFWGFLYLGFDEPVAALFPWGYSVASMVCLLVFARTRSFRFLRAAELTMILVTPAALLVALGGLAPSSGVILWSLLAPLGAVVVAGPRQAWAWFCAFAVLLVVTIPLAPLVRPDEATMPEGAVLAFAALNIGVVSLVAFTLVVTFAREREIAKRRIDALLGNILPDEIAHRLQFEQQAIADHHDEASILFADVVDFTPLSSRLDPREMVGLLDRLFTAFDELADHYDVEKIKTIGDCYMVAAGVPRPRADHAHALVRMAARHARVCAALPPPSRRRRPAAPHRDQLGAGRRGRDRPAALPLRPVGRHGEMASRMESHGAPGAIQITRTTWELVKDDFETVPRGLVPVKGKGDVEACIWSDRVRAHRSA